jgi:AcrR family transcriptional regulator
VSDTSTEPDSPAPTRWESKRARKIERILAVTAQSLRTNGYHNTSLEEIAEALDLTKASLYHYFDSKEALVFQCLENCAREVSERLRAIEQRPGTHVERLRALILEQLDILHRDYSDMVPMFVYPVDWPADIRCAVDQWRHEHDEIFRRVVDAGVDAGEFLVSDPRTARLCLHGALNNTLAWLHTEGNGSGAHALDAIADVVMEMFRPRIAAADRGEAGVAAAGS